MKKPGIPGLFHRLARDRRVHVHGDEDEGQAEVTRPKRGRCHRTYSKLHALNEILNLVIWLPDARGIKVVAGRLLFGGAPDGHGDSDVEVPFDPVVIHRPCRLHGGTCHAADDARP
jgi:hypothetical protein